MDLIVQEDGNGRGGFGWLALDGAGESEDAAFIRETPDNPFLGPDGYWQSVRHVFTLAGGDMPGGGRGLRLIPEIVDNIDPDTEIQVELPGRKLLLSGWWPHLPPSGRVKKPRSWGVGHDAIVKKETDTGTGKDDTKQQADKETKKPIVPPPLPVTTRRRRWPLWLLLFLFLFVAGAAGAWYAGLVPPWLLDRLGLPHPPISSTVATPPPPSNPDCEGASCQSAAQLRQSLKDMIAADASPEELYAFGAPLYALDDSERRNIGYTAIDAAAQRGHPKARYELGRIFDPRDTLPGKRVGVETPNPREAAKYYRLAADAGEERAKEALKGLCGWLAQLGASAGAEEKLAIEESCGG